jgi:hypothetical protein
MFNRRPKHKHDWNLIDKTVIEGKDVGRVRSHTVAETRMIIRLIQGYVVLTFKCDCGEYRIEER